MSLIEIEFKGRRKGVFVNPQQISLKRFDRVIVRADRGEDIGVVSIVGDEWQPKLVELLEIERNGHSNNGKNGDRGKAQDDNGKGKDEKPEEKDETSSSDDTSEETPAETEEATPDEESSEEPAEEALELPDDIPEILRLANDEELEQEQTNRREEREARSHFVSEIRELNLEMNLVDVEYQLDRKKLTFYFTADGRVDFRELVKRLAQHFHTRIDLRQIGARDEAKRLGGIGICGRELCCATWIREFKPVTTSMLKEQGLLLNPQKNTGLCGKLRCCLRYEVDQYREVNRLFPKEGMKVEGPRGHGYVEKISMCHSSMGVKWEDGQRIGYSFDQIRNITNWDHEKRDKIEVITFHEDPSVVQQEKEEREGRLITSFEYEKVLEKRDEDSKKRRKSRRRGGRRKGDQQGEQNKGDGGSGKVVSMQPAAKPSQQKQQAGESGREDDKRSRSSKRGRRGGRGRRTGGGEKQARGEGGAGSGNEQKKENSQPKPDSKDRRPRRGRGKPDSKNQASGSGNKPQDNSGQQSKGGDDRPKGNPVHSRGRKRKR